MSLVDAMVFETSRKPDGSRDDTHGVVRLGAAIVASWRTMEMDQFRIIAGRGFDIACSSRSEARAALRAELLLSHPGLARMETCQERLEDAVSTGDTPAGRALLAIMRRLDDPRDAEGFVLSLERMDSGAWEVDRVRRRVGPDVADNARIMAWMQDLVEDLPLSFLDAAWKARPLGTDRLAVTLCFSENGPWLVSGGREWRLPAPDAPQLEDDDDLDP